MTQPTDTTSGEHFPSPTQQRNAALGLTVLVAIISASVLFMACFCLGLVYLLTPISLRP